MAGVLNFRPDDALDRYLRATARSREVDLSTVIRELIRLGAESKKELEDRLEHKRLQAIEVMKYNDATAEIKHELRRAHLVENFRKLVTQIRAKRIAPKDKKRVVVSALKRIEEVLGRDSIEFKEALTWSRLDEYNSTTKAEKDFTSESAKAEKPDITKSDKQRDAHGRKAKRSTISEQSARRKQRGKGGDSALSNRKKANGKRSKKQSSTSA